MEPQDVVLEDVESLQARCRSLEMEVSGLRAQLDRAHQDLRVLNEKCRKMDRMDKGLNLIQKWAEDHSDEFLIDLVDLIDD